MSDYIVRSRSFLRFGEMMVPFFSWMVILMPLWLSPFHPALVAYFIIAFDIYFLYKSVLTSYFATYSYTKIRDHQDIPYFKLVQTKSDNLSIINPNEINHFIVIPNYKEPLYKIEETLTSISKSDYPYKNLILVLAFEAIEEEVVNKAEILKKNWKTKFKDILVTYHPLKVGEVQGKASNQTFSARYIQKYCLEHHYDPKSTIITICDADSQLPVNFFSYMTYEFLRDENRLFHFYWAPVLLYNNFWKLPFFVRMQATISSILRLAFLSQDDKLIHISTYSTSLWLLSEVDFWDVDIIPEDWHIYYQAFFKFGKSVKTIPLYTIVNGDAVNSGGLLKTLLSRYEQEKRWAWGVTDISYFWGKLFITPHIDFFTKLKKLFNLVETHLLWPTSFFVLTISGMIPPLINPVFKRTVMGFILPQLSGFILTIATAMILLYVYLDIRLRERLKVQTKLVNLPFLLIQWYLLPLVSFVLSSLPALDAHTRLLFGYKIKYKVTEKI